MAPEWKQVGRGERVLFRDSVAVATVTTIFREDAKNLYEWSAAGRNRQRSTLRAAQLDAEALCLIQRDIQAEYENIDGTVWKVTSSTRTRSLWRGDVLLAFIGARAIEEYTYWWCLPDGVIKDGGNRLDIALTAVNKALGRKGIKSKETIRRIREDYRKRPYVIEKRKEEGKEYRSRPESIEKTKKWREGNAERIYMNNVKLKFGVDSSTYEKIAYEQDSRCAICNTDKDRSGRRLHVDHDHKTNAVRGFLCGSCNSGLGLFLDSPDLLRKAIAYLGKPTTARLGLKDEIASVYKTAVEAMSSNRFIAATKQPPSAERDALIAQIVRQHPPFEFCQDGYDCAVCDHLRPQRRAS